jgi:hypothetical protein
MNQLITFDEAAAVLRTPAFPKMARPDFTVVRALRKHLHAALAKLECPQSRVYGWTGLAMAPAMYAMIEVNPFTIPIDPGPTPAYNPAIFQTPVQMRTAEQMWEYDRRYYLSYENIHRACFRLLDEIVRPEFKVSNIPGLNGWNSTMTIQAILGQLETTFGRPSGTVLFQNNATFTSPFNPMDTPESLFQRIEECQQIGVLGGTPYTDAQIVNTTMYLFMQSNIFPNKEFETWEGITPKTWPALKLHVQAAYQRKIVASSFRNTSGQMGYAPNHNAFNAFVGDDESSVDTIATQVAAAAATAPTVGSTLGSTYQASTGGVTSELTTAIQTLAANQQALYQHVAPLTQQMAAMSYQPGTARQNVYPPPNTNSGVPTVPTYIGFQGGGNLGTPRGGFQQGRGGGRGFGRGRTYGRGRGARRSGRGLTAFADYVPQGRGYGGNSAAAHRPFQSNLVKSHNNWNVCYSCGFDVEDGHTSSTCHMDWRKPTHDVSFTRENAQLKLSQGCDACTRGMHKTMLPGQA